MRMLRNSLMVGLTIFAAIGAFAYGSQLAGMPYNAALCMVLGLGLFAVGLMSMVQILIEASQE